METLMKRLKLIAGSIIVIIAVSLVVDYLLVEAKDDRVFGAISRCDGRCASIPFWPLGTEYRVTFPRALTSAELKQLDEINSLRGAVGVAFVDCELSANQVREAMAKLHNCRLYRIRDGERSVLDDREPEER